MPSQATLPRATFDCLWCGRSWTTRSPDDLEGWAQLCPDCLGKAGDNPFLKFRTPLYVPQRKVKSTAKNRCPRAEWKSIWETSPERKAS